MPRDRNPALLKKSVIKDVANFPPPFKDPGGH